MSFEESMHNTHQDKKIWKKELGEIMRGMRQIGAYPEDTISLENQIH